jgi:hypothetical protein
MLGNYHINHLLVRCGDGPPIDVGILIGEQNLMRFRVNRFIKTLVMSETGGWDRSLECHRRYTYIQHHLFRNCTNLTFR